MQWDPSGAGVLALPSGRLVRGRSLRTVGVPPPEWGLYVTLRRPRVDRPHRWVRWPDFGLPTNDAAAREAVAEAWSRSEVERVEVACGGGVGRTGTVLAAMAVRDGLTPGDAVAWVRARYHPRAVETPWQRRWLAR